MLHLKDVRKSFVQPDGTQLPILDIAEFHVDAGEQMVLVGRSGCGKTTLLHVIAGISRPDSGKVRIDDWDITLFPRPNATASARADRLRLSDFQPAAGFSALENVLVAMRFTGRRPDRGRARQLLERVGLDHRVTHRPAHALRRRAAAGGGRPGAGQQAQAPAGRRADGQRRRRPPAAGARPVARDLPRGERRPGAGHPPPEVARQFDRVEQLEEFNRAAEPARD